METNNCRRLLLRTGAAILLQAHAAFGQTPTCTELRYGTSAQAAAIESALYSGSVVESVAAIRAGQATRGTDLGCAETTYPVTPASSTAPTLTAIRASWAEQITAASQSVATYDRCPAVGRGAGAYALGGWTARSAGLSFPEAPLRAIADNFLATQYGADKTPGTQQTWAGLYGYATRLGVAGDACFVSGVLGDALSNACAQAPSLCSTYRTGRFANERFAVADFDAAAGLRDGGAGFDQGWAGVMMIEASLGSTDRVASARYRQSALAAADWAVAEPAVRNHNYTAKLIWLLAAAYDWTGESRYRDALIDKLERSLLPSVLMDENGDGLVDNVPGVKFADLRAPAARIPGRVWDAHNALPQYQAMNAIALVEAYAAFRARGDAVMRDRVRPYALAILDNQAAEFQAVGGTVGATQAFYAFALALWKISDPEGLARPQWERALWQLWNSGLGSSSGDSKTAAAAIVAARAEGRAWQSKRSRGALSAATAPLDARISGLWYDPSTSGEGLNLTLVAPDRLVATWFTYKADGSGEPFWLIADGHFDGKQFSATALSLRGTQFGANFNSADLIRSPWGTINIEFSRCDAATLRWNSVVPGFSSGTRNLILLSGISDRGC